MTPCFVISLQGSRVYEAVLDCTLDWGSRMVITENEIMRLVFNDNNGLADIAEKLELIYTGWELKNVCNKTHLTRI